jgi:hypothetical protein
MPGKKRANPNGPDNGYGACQSLCAWNAVVGVRLFGRAAGDQHPLPIPGSAMVSARSRETTLWLDAEIHSYSVGLCFYSLVSIWRKEAEIRRDK